MNAVQQPADVIRIVDDDPSIRDAFCFLLDGEGWRTRAYPDADSFLNEDDLSTPGCVVLDVRMPDSMSGLELQERLMESAEALPIIFVSAHGDIEMAVHTMRNGAVDFLPKPVDEAKLLDAIGRATELCHRRLQERLSQSARLENWNTLTPREKEVAELLALGMPNKTVADRLGMTTRTVQVHRAAIYLKLGVRSAAEIANLMQGMRPRT